MNRAHSGFCFWLLLVALTVRAAPIQFEVRVAEDLPITNQSGRLFVILSRTNNPEPRLDLGNSQGDAPQTFAQDVPDFSAGKSLTLASTSGFPRTNISELPAGNYFIQGLFDSSRDLRLRDAPGNFYSRVQRIRLDPAKGASIRIDLDRQIPPEQLPPDTEQVKFLKIQSKLLSQFHGRPMFLRAGIILPRDYEREKTRRYPLWVRIGGFGTRYPVVNRLMDPRLDFRKTWMAEGTPRFILLQLDGAGPFGDPYYVNSANNGPFGDALVQELIPAVEARFRAVAQPHGRVLSGTSTGGWVALALQTFYPDFFNGAWASCPDPVDFRAFQLMNLYEDENAYVTPQGGERPSARNLSGQVTLTMRREVGLENLVGHNGVFTTSGEQWGSWNAVFSPRGPDGRPRPLWNPVSGKLDRQVAENCKQYDLHLVLSQNWKSLAPKLRGKFRIASGEADQYYLNGAVHLLDDFLRHANPPADARVVFGPGKGHGWFNLSLHELLEEMDDAVKRP